MYILVANGGNVVGCGATIDMCEDMAREYQAGVVIKCSFEILTTCRHGGVVTGKRILKI